MKDVEKAGLVKFDFLGLSTLTMLRRPSGWCASAARRSCSTTLPLDDRPTYELLARGRDGGRVPAGIGRACATPCASSSPTASRTSSPWSSLYRPGPMDNIPRYINVKHGLEEPEYLHPLLEPILEETNGVIIYQEQVMEIAKQLAGYTLGGADLLRRAMGKKIKSEMDAQREVFIEGAIASGIADEPRRHDLRAVAKFASYGFNKSHAAAYALLAYQTAYLKANHPVEFFAAAMTIEIGQPGQARDLPPRDARAAASRSTRPT